MNYKQILAFVFSIFLMSFGLPKNIQKKVDKEIKSVFSLEIFEIETIKIPESISSELPSIFNGDNFFQIKSNNSFMGYAYVGKAPSKTDQFDFLVLFDSEFIIKKSKVLIYREDYGGEIGSKRWLKQFIGKSGSDTLLHGKDIMAIAGATISTMSMTKAINNLLKSIKILHRKAIL